MRRAVIKYYRHLKKSARRKQEKEARRHAEGAEREAEREAERILSGESTQARGVQGVIGHAERSLAREIPTSVHSTVLRVESPRYVYVTTRGWLDFSWG
jgi:hypothetical protein